MRAALRDRLDDVMLGLAAMLIFGAAIALSWLRRHDRWLWSDTDVFGV